MTSKTRILGDWGTSNLRLWLWQDGAIIDRINGRSLGALAADAPARLSELIQGWRKEYVIDRMILCGMAGARGGLYEADYVSTPADAAGWSKGSVRTSFEGLPLTIAAGVTTAADDQRADVMRGEEAQIFGVMATAPELASGAHSIILPGTHSKWVSVNDGQITDLRTFMTGELHALLSRSSLFAGAQGDGPATNEAEGFAEGLTTGKTSPSLTANLFHARAAQLRNGKSGLWAKGYISGLLLADEVAQMQAQTSLPQRVALVGSPDLCARYSEALTLFAVQSFICDDEACTMAGLELINAHDE